MNCPICFDKLSQSVVFKCGHATCQPCYELSGVTKCPLCRSEITSVQSAPYFDCREIDNDSSQEDISQQEKVIIDPRGKDLLKKAKVLLDSRKEVLSKLDSVVSLYDKYEEDEKVAYELQMKKLHDEHIRKIQTLQIEKEEK